MTSVHSIVLAPLGALYGAAARMRRALYASNVFRVHRIDAPVISVGNLTTGGTGKTPTVEWLARAIAHESKRVCILTRGHGRKAADRRVIVSDGESIRAGASSAGDEPVLLAENLLGQAAVISDADRVSAANWARENFATEVFILDDGFQYLRLARDLNILIIDATNPWGGGLLPGGRLREPLNGMKRADCIVITHANQAKEIESIERRIGQFVGDRAVFKSSIKTKRLRPMQAGRVEEATGWQTTTPEPVAAFCGIGNPQSFFTHLNSDGHSLCYSRVFSDHHRYRQAEVDEVIREARKKGAKALLTTAKDAVKLRSLRFDLPCYVVEIEMQFDNESALREIVRTAIKQ